MAKFIELTDFSDQRIMVNVDNILWVRPYEAENGSMVFVALPGRNNYPFNINVKESYSETVEKLQ